MKLTDVYDLYKHMEWADAAVWTVVLSSANGQTDARLRDCLYHLHLVQQAFLGAWRDETSGAPYPTFEDAAALLQWGRSYYGEAFAHLASLSDAQLAEPLPLPWATMIEQQLGHPPATSTLGDTILQVALHTLYHRGQINARLREIGHEPPLVDYIAWIWMGRPSPAWPALAT